MDKHFDVIVIGGGPAGLSAAIYLARAQYSVLVVEKERLGGQIAITSEVVNYPGILRTNGEELSETMRRQAERFGAQFLMAEVQDLQLQNTVKAVKTDQGDFTALGVVVATGAAPRKIGFPGEAEFQGRGISYCATCDGEFFTGKDIFVIGGGFAAAEEAVFLTKYARKVHMIVREEDFACGGVTAQHAKEHPNIEVTYQTEVERVEGDTALRRAVFKNNQTGETFEYKAEPSDTFGMFVFAGYVPATKLLEGKVLLDQAGYVLTDVNQKTNVDGVYAAGDLCVKDLRQLVTAVSDGATAATALERVLTELHRQGFERGKRGPTAQNAKAEPAAPSQSPEAPKAEQQEEEEGFLSPALRAQLEGLFGKFQRTVLLQGVLDESPLAKEMAEFLKELSGISKKVQVSMEKAGKPEKGVFYPTIRLCDETGKYLGVQYHAVPGGHEFNSFIAALYNAAGPGQAADEETLGKARALKHKTNIKVLTTLACSMCPDVVTGTQRIALENPLIEAEMFDILHYPELRKKYNVMSVPCMIINDKDVTFGRKSFPQIVDLVEKAIAQ